MRGGEGTDEQGSEGEEGTDEQGSEGGERPNLAGWHKS